MSENLVLFGGPRERLKLAHEILTEDNIKLMTFDDFFFSCGDTNKVIALWTELIPVVDSKLVNLLLGLGGLAQLTKEHFVYFCRVNRKSKREIPNFSVVAKKFGDSWIWSNW